MFFRSRQYYDRETNTDDICDDILTGHDNKPDDVSDQQPPLELDAAGRDSVPSISKRPPRQPCPVLPPDIPVQGET